MIFMVSIQRISAKRDCNQLRRKKIRNEEERVYLRRSKASAATEANKGEKPRRLYLGKINPKFLNGFVISFGPSKPTLIFLQGKGAHYNPIGLV